MCNQIEAPPEVRRFQAQQWRSYRWHAWGRASLIALLCAGVLLGLLWRRGAPFPLGLIAAFVLVPAIFPGLVYAPMPILVLRMRAPWCWDEHAIAIRRVIRPWGMFERFQVERACLVGASGHLVRTDQAGLEAGEYAVLRLKVRNRPFNPGGWVSINARTADIEQLAACAARHVGVSSSPSATAR